MLDYLSEALVEAHRLQVLAFIGRRARGAGATPTETACWLRIPTSECSQLVAELADEGFVEEESSAAGTLRAPLRLTAVGLGVLEWNRRSTGRGGRLRG